MTVRCADCGAHYGIGAWWKCPHEPMSTVRQPDVTWPGGKTFENLGHEPQTFYSPAEQRAYMKAHNLEPFVRHQPLQGSDKSPYTTNWAAVSAESLAGAKAMLERTAQEQNARRDYVQSMTVTTTEVPHAR